MRFNCDTSIASSHYKTYNGTPKVLCREGRTVASVVDLMFQAPPLLEWGRVYVEEVREEEETVVGGEQEPAGIRDLSFVLSDPDTWGQHGLNGFRLTDCLGRGRTQMTARAN